MYTFQKINKPKVSDAVFEQLRQGIIQQDFPIGSKLPSEQSLAQSFGVSRTSVRAAIQRLATLGLLETRTGEGTYVREPSTGNLIEPLFKAFRFKPSQILEILEFRLAIEMLSCRLAASRATSEQLGSLRQIVDEMLKAAANNDQEHYSLEDMQFHICLADMSHNSLVSLVVENLSDFYLGHLVELNRQIDLSFNINYHTGIYDAICRRDGESAAESMKKMITRSMSEVQKWTSA